MKHILAIIILATSLLHAGEVENPYEPFLTKFDLKSENVTVRQDGTWVYVTLLTKTTAGQRLVCALAVPEAGKKELFLDYYFVQNMEASFRHLEPVKVEWKIFREHWEKPLSGNLVFFRKLKDVGLRREQIEHIKRDWKLEQASKHDAEQDTSGNRR